MFNIYSHIQLPHTILRHFRDEYDPEKKVWYLDTTTKQINKLASGRLGTSRNYYSPKVEKHWANTVESPIGKLNQRVLAFCSGQVTTINFTQNDMEIVKQYLYAALGRNERVFSAMESALPNAEKFTKQQRHDFFSVYGMSVAYEVANEYGFDKMIASIIINRTDRNFVVPRNCFYTVKMDDYECYVMPISPKCAFLLLPSNLLQAKGGNYGIIDDSEQILRLNIYALKYECLHNHAFVATNCQAELEYLKQILMNPPW